MKNYVIELCLNTRELSNDHFLKSTETEDVLYYEDHVKHLSNSPAFSMYLTPASSSEVNK